jgi:hypothetical protein
MTRVVAGVLAAFVLTVGFSQSYCRAQSSSYGGGSAADAGYPTSLGQNPYSNPLMNPFMNPYMMSYPGLVASGALGQGSSSQNRTDMLLYMMAAQQASGGIGSGRIGGAKASGPKNVRLELEEGESVLRPSMGLRAKRYYTRKSPNTAPVRSKRRSASEYFRQTR